MQKTRNESGAIIYTPSREDKEKYELKHRIKKLENEVEQLKEAIKLIQRRLTDPQASL